MSGVPSGLLGKQKESRKFSMGTFPKLGFWGQLPPGSFAFRSPYLRRVPRPPPRALHAQAPPHDVRPLSFSRHPQGEPSPGNILVRRGPAILPRVAPAVFSTFRHGGMGLLPDAEPRAPDRPRTGGKVDPSAIGNAHREYSRWVNERRLVTGHLWANRYY